MSTATAGLGIVGLFQQIISAPSRAGSGRLGPAMYAGLRRGDLRALRWSAIDLEAGVIRVERGWDDEEGEIEVKTRAGRRTVPILTRLRRELVEHKLRMGRDGDALVLGSSARSAFEPSTIPRRALEAWKDAARPDRTA